jgi:thiamine monophosphate synthase
VIGGVTAADFSLLKSLGASGAAMSGAIARAIEPLSAAKVITTAGQACWGHQPRA